MRHAYKILYENLNGRKTLGDLSLHYMTILKWILEKEGIKG
jgi:hypothetical protein